MEYAQHTWCLPLSSNKRISKPKVANRAGEIGIQIAGHRQIMTDRASFSARRLRCVSGYFWTQTLSAAFFSFYFSLQVDCLYFSLAFYVASGGFQVELRLIIFSQLLCL